MKFLIADSFADALGKLTGSEQKGVKITVYDLQQDPSAPGLQFHRISNSKDTHFWSIRAGRDIRIVIHKTKSSFLVCYVDHHDNAYKWAERRRIEAHPRTGAAQIVEVRERIEEIVIPAYVAATAPEEVMAADVPAARFLPPLFLKLSEDDLLNIGVPQDWLGDVHNASEDNFLDLADHIPAEASEALLDYVSTGVLQIPGAAPVGVDPLMHPDAQRRFRVLDNVEELTLALEFPWDKWAIFLHPSQRSVVEQKFNGPARVAGSAGTGKTVVALHRVQRILAQEPKTKVLLTTFSSPLANALEHKLKLLCGETMVSENRVTVLDFNKTAHDLFTLVTGFHPRIARQDRIKTALLESVKQAGITEFTERFLLSEYLYVIDAWQLKSIEEYATVPRLGRKNRLGAKQRERIWPVFDRVRSLLEKNGQYSWPSIFGKVSDYYKGKAEKPFSHIVVDEAQDLGVPELRMLAAISADEPDALFFAGDLGQRIFKEPFSWKGLGVDIRGRSSTLKVNYRTSHQIRRSVDKLLPDVVRDVDGVEEDRRSTVSIFNGPEPEIKIFSDNAEECAHIGLWIYEIIDEGTLPEEIGVFVRSNTELVRARNAVKQAGQKVIELSDRVQERGGRVSIGTMHLAKGLEFKAVAVMACDEDVLPDQARMESVVDETELNEVHTTERHLFYVALTRAREKLLISGVSPASEFIDDLQ